MRLGRPTSPTRVTRDSTPVWRYPTFQLGAHWYDSGMVVFSNYLLSSIRIGPKSQREWWVIFGCSKIPVAPKTIQVFVYGYNSGLRPCLHLPQIYDEILEYARLQEPHLIFQHNSSVAGAVLRVNLIRYFRRRINKNSNREKFQNIRSTMTLVMNHAERRITPSRELWKVYIEK